LSHTAGPLLPSVVRDMQLERHGLKLITPEVCVTAISLDGQSIAATAARLSMSEVAVRVALHRALKSLAAAWRSATQ